MESFFMILNMDMDDFSFQIPQCWIKVCISDILDIEGYFVKLTQKFRCKFHRLKLILSLLTPIDRHLHSTHLVVLILRAGHSTNSDLDSRTQQALDHGGRREWRPHGHELDAQGGPRACRQV